MSANHMFSKRAITLIIGTLLVKKKATTLIIGTDM